MSAPRRVASRRGCLLAMSPGKVRQRRASTRWKKGRSDVEGERTNAAAFEWRGEATRRNFRNCARHFRMQCVYTGFLCASASLRSPSLPRPPHPFPLAVPSKFSRSKHRGMYRRSGGTSISRQFRERCRDVDFEFE